MDLYLIILMFDMLESLESISGLISAAVFAFASFLGIITFINTQINKKAEIALPFKPLKAIYILCTIGILASVIAILVPEKKTMYLAAGAYIAQSTLESEEGQKVRKILQLELDKYLQEETEELSKSKNKENKEK